MFKADWEKTSIAYQLPEGMVEEMVRLAYPDKKLISHELIAGGCANLNIKILLKDETYPLILRVYLRDKDAAYREQKLSKLLKEAVPAPLTHYIGELEGHHFAITEFMPGIPLRELLLGDAPHDVSAIMYEVGTILSKITGPEFSEAGFFDKELNVIPHSLDDYLIFAKDCLKHETVLSVLTSDVISKISQALGYYDHLFPDENQKHLVHADFDPANILVRKVDGLWKVSGVLDWEFAFSGSVLWDVANMLRYAHKMPDEFQDAFLRGLASGGVTLPKNWHISIQLLNLLSLLDCLKRSNHKDHPNLCADIRELIDPILSALNISIRKLSASDIPIMVDAFQQANWLKPTSIFETYLQEQGDGARVVWVAQVDNQFAGYVTLKCPAYAKASAGRPSKASAGKQYKPFATASIPEIMDLNVLPPFRNVGVGSMLLNIAEKEAATKSDVVGLGVGLYGGPDGGYGAAQRLYVKRGYIPDGKGVTYNYKPATPGNHYRLDDDLILWFTKKLR
ncbi:MAG TPA: GNAT family N-acetyltransferase [Gammaproteobacteria bacterium]|nr:GNAT family N-acetyltransferase [Gammaproteobacteria bacterium]